MLPLDTHILRKSFVFKVKRLVLRNDFGNGQYIDLLELMLDNVAEEKVGVITFSVQNRRSLAELINHCSLT